MGKEGVEKKKGLRRRDKSWIGLFSAKQLIKRTLFFTVRQILLIGLFLQFELYVLMRRQTSQKLDMDQINTNTVNFLQVMFTVQPLLKS